MNEPYVKLQTESIYWDRVKENGVVSSTLQQFKPTLIKNTNLETLKSFEGRFLIVPDPGRIYYEYANSENSEPAKRVELGNADLDYVKVLAAAPTSSEGLEKNMFYLVPSTSDNIYDLYAVDENDKLVGPVAGKAVKATLTENYGTDYIVSKTSFIRPGKENGQVGSSAVSFGDNNYAGYTCRKITAYDGEFTLTLEPNPQGYEPANKLAVGDIISIDGGTNYPYCATIETINGNTITVDRSIVDYAGKAMNPNSEDHLLYVDGKPNTGTRPLGEGQVAIGLQNHAIAKATTAIGRQNYASGSYSVALGRENKAANYSVALGRRNKAIGFDSISLGSDNNSTGLYATAIGMQNTASGEYSFATGYSTIASGARSVSFGMRTVASGDCSFAVGYNTYARGQNSFAFGGEVTAANDNTLVFGTLSSATHKHAIAIGDSVKSEGQYTLAVGKDIWVRHQHGIAIGLGLVTDTTTTVGQAVVGRYNRSEDYDQALFVVGNGSSYDARSNAFRVMADGSAEVKEMSEKDNCVTTKSYVDNALLERVYPIGSIYMSIEDKNPAELFGGEWEQLKDRFLLGAGDSYVAGEADGEATHMLTTAEIAAQTMSVPASAQPLCPETENPVILSFSLKNSHLVIITERSW